MEPQPRRAFVDEDGQEWVATVRERPGTDFKGRYYLYLEPRESSGSDGVPLGDVRWNSHRTASRTLGTMSGVELRRRLRSAQGRARTPLTREPADRLE